MRKIIYLSLFFILTLYTAGIAQGIDKPRYQLVTNRAGNYLGTFELELFPSIAPMHVNNFDSLVNMQFFDSTAFHRVVPGFVIQGGDPNSINGPISTWGQGQSWQVTVNAEFSPARHYRGRLGAARDVDTNSANSQFYICVANAFNLDGQYTVYGQVTSGMNIVDSIVNSPRDANDNPLQKIEMFVTYIGVNDTVPADPSLTTPVDQAVDVPGGVTFQWSNISDAVIYYLQVSTDSLFGSFVMNKRVGVNSGAASGLSPFTTYYWRVMADNGGHQSNWATPFRFTTGGPASLIAPPDNAVNIPLNPIFQWTAVPNATTYNIQIDTDTLFGLPLTSNVSGISTNSKQVTGLPASTQLYWRVRYFTGSASGFFSDIFEFNTGSGTSGIDELYSKGGAYIKNIYPVPADKSITVEMGAPVSSPVNIMIKDISGKDVLIKEAFRLPADKKLLLNTSHLKPGLYLLTVQTVDMEETRKIEIR
jgi:cyclophilin family peptidyl-prolyl cis-trans isomerase